VGQAQCGGGKKQRVWGLIAAAGENVDDDRGREDVLREGLLTSRFHSKKAIGRDTAEDRHHLFVAVVHAFELAAHGCHRCRQHPVLERSAIAQCTRFAGQNRDIVPGIIDGLIPAKTAGVFCDDDAILPNDDPLGIGVNLDRSSDRCRDHGILVVIEPDEAGLGDGGWNRVEAIESTDIGHKGCALCLEHLPDHLVAAFRVFVRFGVGDALVEQPHIQLVQTFDPQTRGEEPFTDQADLVLNLTLLPPRSGRAGPFVLAPLVHAQWTAAGPDNGCTSAESVDCRGALCR